MTTAWVATWACPGSLKVSWRTAPYPLPAYARSSPGPEYGRALGAGHEVGQVTHRHPEPGTRRVTGAHRDIDLGGAEQQPVQRGCADGDRGGRRDARGRRVVGLRITRGKHTDAGKHECHSMAH